METSDYLRTVSALVLVLGLILGLLWLLRRIGVPGMVPTRQANRRLSVVESVALDARRRLVLVRRDGQEHLLLLGHTADLVVETGIDNGTAAPDQEDKG
ncbi:MAG: flagellar biosynthetic protein FliO [Magnetospirillum sp.]